jgi:hypothetical protein
MRNIEPIVLIRNVYSPSRAYAEIKPEERTTQLSSETFSP